MSTQCSAATSEAVRVFRQTGNPRYISAIIRGVLERHVAAEFLPKLYSGDGSLRLAEDLGIDSLTRMEIALRTEEAAGFPFESQELARVLTVNDLERALRAKASLQA